MKKGTCEKCGGKNEILTETQTKEGKLWLCDYCVRKVEDDKASAGA